METTRRFPRTLAEAFPNDPRNACAIEHSTRSASLIALVGEVLMLSLLAMAVAGALVWMVMR